MKECKKGVFEMKHYTVCGEEIGRVIGDGNFEEMVKAGFFEKIKANNPDETGDFGDYAFFKDGVYQFSFNASDVVVK